MTASTTGIELRTAPRTLRDAIELLSSMRFAIALLALICIVSVIGTLVTQHQPPVNYVNQFGPFWAQVFGTFGLYAVYSAPWFLLILAFLVTSTSLCIARNAPKILVDLKTYKEHLRESSLMAFHHKAQGEIALASEVALAQVSQALAAGGWKAKAQVREHGTMVAAKKGTANRLGYLSAHSAIVLVCLGGLLDGDLIVRAQMAWQGKTPFAGSGMVRDVPGDHRLGAGNPTFRANLFVPEGARAGTAVINLTDGVVLQELPFDVELKKFIVDYYDTGMPKLFASEIAVHDADGQTHRATVKVNEPFIHQGIAIYQSSFEDGGSKLTLQAQPFGRAGQPFDVTGEIGATTTLNQVNGAGDKMQLEFTGLRVINVENLAANKTEAVDVRGVDFAGTLNKHLGSGARSPGNKQLRNIGPSVSYKLRDAAGQAREFNNYMLPVELDGIRVFLAGVRDGPDQDFRYLRIPADEQGSANGWLHLKAALADGASREEAARRYARHSSPVDKPQLQEQLRISALRALSLFAGAERAPQGQRQGAGAAVAGLQALQDFIEANVPETDRVRTTEVLVRILNGSLFELVNLVRERDSQAALAPDEATQRFMGQAVLALADSFAYPAPLLFTLKDFQQVQASVFQVTRAPGKKLVYLGCIFLILGVFTMLYIRERRLWIWIEPAGAGSKLTLALSATRQTLDTDREFDALKNALLSPPGH
ncbi:MAG: cytochrome c biogenesis protein ResB [Burkholderiales bacterium]